MNDRANGAVQAAEDDELSTTAPNPKSDTWKMPEPVFRKTSGRLPKPFEPKPAGAVVSTPETSPDLLIPGAPVLAPDPGPKSPVLKIFIVVLALAAMIAFIAIFLTAVYFLFLR